MSIIKFNYPSDTKILHDIGVNNLGVKFVGNACVRQCLSESIFTRVLRFNHQNVVKKVTYKKIRTNWILNNLEVVD